MLEEVLDILSTHEQENQPLFPQLNLRQWTSSIYAWLTHPVLDPTRSGRVTMDNLMKLVVTALEWSDLDGKTDVAPRGSSPLQGCWCCVMIRSSSLMELVLPRLQRIRHTGKSPV